MDRQNYFHLALVSVGVLILTLLVSHTIPALESLELKTIDWRFSWRGVQEPQDSPIVLVTIDDQSFEVLPERWPYPRSYYAKVINNLSRAGAKVIGLDVILDVPDRAGAQSDRQLAEAVAQTGKVVLARKLEQSSRLQSYRYLVEPIDILKNAAGNGLGLVSIGADPDGIYRRYSAGQYHNDQLLSSFAIELLRKYKGYEADLPLTETGNAFHFGEFEIPHYLPGSILIDFAGPRGTFPTYSFSTVIDDADFDLGEDNDLDYFSEELLPAGVFKDKIVIIGSTVAELHDNFPTPFLEYNGIAQEMPGVEILANAANTILHSSYYSVLPFWATLIMVVALMTIVLFIALRAAAQWSVVATIAMIVAYVIFTIMAFSGNRVVLEIVFPVLGMFLSFVGANLYQYVITQKEKQIILGAFQQYVPAKVIQELMDHPEKLSLGGEERVMTVMFSDVAGFTTISESLSPTQLVTLINEYLSEMTDIILQHDGIIDKYEGDAIMAEFGAPVYYEEHAVKACYAALEMQQRLKQLSRKWRRQGRPVLSCRVGINTGNMIVGNMGSKQVFDYTVLGDEVNLASRLEGANKIFGTRIMISHATQKLVKDHIVTRPLDLIIVKGKSKPVRVHEVMERKDQKMEESLRNILTIYLSGINYFYSRNWEQAAECFRYCLRLAPDDGPSKLYLRRSVEYLKTPPPENWNGVYQLESK